MKTATHALGYGRPGRLPQALHLLAQPAPIALSLAAVFGASFALLRDSVAPGIPDSQAIPFATYPGFAVDYSSGAIDLLDSGALMFLFCSSAGMLILGGLLMSYFSASRAGVVWGGISALILIATADIQMLLPMRGYEGTIRSLIVIKGGMVSWDVRRVLMGSSLLMVGVVVGYGLRCAAHRYRRGENPSQHSSARQCRRLSIVLVVFLLCRTGFLIIRDLMGQFTAASQFTLYPWQFLTGGDGSFVLVLAAIVGLLIVALAVGLSARPWQKTGLAWMVLGTPAIAVLDVTLSMSWRPYSMEGFHVVTGLVLSIALMEIGVVVIMLTIKVLGRNALLQRPQ